MIIVSGSPCSTSRVTRLSCLANMSFSATWLRLNTSPSWLQLSHLPVLRLLTNENRDLLPRLIISSKDFDYLSAVLRSIKELEVVHLPFDKLFTQDFQNLVQKVQRNFPTRTVLVGSESKPQGVNNLKHYSQANRRRQVLQVPVPVPPPERAQDQDINAEQGNFYDNYY